MPPVQRKSDFTCFKCSRVIYGPYEALTKHFRDQYGFKPQGEREMTNSSVGKMVVSRKFIHSPIFAISCRYVKEIFFIWIGTLAITLFCKKVQRQG